MAVPAGVAVPLLMWLRLLVSMVGRLFTWQGVVLGCCVAMVTRWWFRPRPRLPPGPAGLLLVGNLLALRAAEHENQLCVKLGEWNSRHGPVITIHIGTKPFVIVSSLTAILDAVGKAEFYRDDGRLWWTKQNWMTRPDKEAKEAVSPSRHIRHLISKVVKKLLFNGTFEECVTSSLDSVISRIRDTHRQPFDPQPLMVSLAFDVITTLCFSKRVHPDDTMYQTFIRAHLRLNDLLKYKYLEELTAFPTIFKLTRTEERDILRSEMLAFVTSQMDRCRSSLSDEAGSSVTPQDLVSHILQAQVTWSEGKKSSRRKAAACLSEDFMEAFICDLLRDNIESIRLTLNWTLLYLASLPYMQRRCQQEIDILLDGHAPGLEDCVMLPYTEAVLYEVMRVRPSAPLGTPRIATCDACLGGYEIPKGTRVLFNHWSVNMDPNTWTKPEDFRPERFLDEQGRHLIRPQAWSPFAAGQKTGLGENASRLQLLLIISSLLHNFNIALITYRKADLELTRGSFWSAPKPYMVVCRPRDKRHAPEAWQDLTVNCSHRDPSALSLGISSYIDQDDLSLSTLRYMDSISEGTRSSKSSEPSDVSGSTGTVQSGSGSAI